MAGQAPCQAVRPSQSRPPPRTDHRQVIDRIGARLQAVGVPAAFFQANTYLTHGYTEALFAKQLRVLSNFETEEKFEAIMQIGISNRSFHSIQGLNAETFYSFLKYLRSQPGQNALSQMAQRLRLARRGAGTFNAQQIGQPGQNVSSQMAQRERLARHSAGTFNAQEIGWLSMLEAQRSDMATRLDDVRRYHELAIADLEQQLCNTRAEMENELNAARLRFSPAGTYVPMTNSEFNRACWAEFTNAAARAGRQPVLLSEQSLSEAVHAYAEVARHRHILNFLAEGGRQDALELYVKREIGGFDVAHEERAAKRFRGLLEIAGTVPTPRAAQGVQREDMQENPGGENPPIEQGNLFDRTFVDLKEGVVDADAGGGTQAESHDQQRGGDAAIPPRDVEVSHTRLRSGTVYRRGQSSHTVGKK